MQLGGEGAWLARGVVGGSFADPRVSPPMDCTKRRHGQGSAQLTDPSKMDKEIHPQRRNIYVQEKHIYVQEELVYVSRPHAYVPEAHG